MITLYQFNGCPFCSKVRALLNFSKTPYDVVEVSPRGMKELQGITDHKKVPVLRDVDTDGNEKIIVESAKIIEYINENYAKLPVSKEDKKWTDWLDKTLVHYLPPLIHPDFKTSFTHIKRISNSGGLKGFMVALVGAMVMPKVARKMKERHNIQNPQKEYLDDIDYWVKDGLNGKPFYGGEQASFVDCSVFGVLRSGHQLGIVKMAKQHNKEFALWYDKCYPLMSEDRI
jgi:microsomal prostaglandin-E synthase 2